MFTENGINVTNNTQELLKLAETTPAFARGFPRHQVDLSTINEANDLRSLFGAAKAARWARLVLNQEDKALDLWPTVCALFLSLGGGYK